MNVIARTNMPQITKTIYADDIVLQAENVNDMQSALSKFTKVCNKVGLVISPTKSKVLTRCRNNFDFKIQGTKLDRVTDYRYLGVTIGSYRHLIKAIKQTCTTRLSLLRRVAGGMIGSSVITLKMLYKAVIRSVIDYHASNILDIKKTMEKTLEAIQNTAIRIILGCPPSTREENARAEVGLEPLTIRRKTVAAVQLVRSLQSDRDGILDQALHREGNRLPNRNRWIVASKSLLQDTGYKDYTGGECLERQHPSELPPWTLPAISISTPHTTGKELIPQARRQEYSERVSKLPPPTTTCYTDGSVKSDGRSGGGVIFKDSNKETTNYDCFRASNHLSSTQIELLSVRHALRVLACSPRSTIRCVHLVTDSRSALESLKNNTSTNKGLIHSIYKEYINLLKRGGCVYFVWAPSHCGIKGNEEADRLAEEGTRKDHITYKITPPISRFRLALKERETEKYLTDVVTKRAVTPSMAHYHSLTNSEPPDYITLGMHERSIQTSFSRLRLGCKYLWEVTCINKPEINSGEILTTSDGRIIDTRCRLCKELHKHTLHHYVEECPEVAPCRPQGLTYEELLRLFSQPVHFKFLKNTLGHNFLPSK